MTSMTSCLLITRIGESRYTGYMGGACHACHAHSARTAFHAASKESIAQTFKDQFEIELNSIDAVTRRVIHMHKSNGMSIEKSLAGDKHYVRRPN